MRLGDSIAMALGIVGVTPERLQLLLGIDDCGCDRRKDQLNALDAWARRVLAGKTENAGRHLFSLFSADAREAPEPPTSS